MRSKVKVKGQGHFMVTLGSQWSNFPGSNFYRINFKLDGNVPCTQALSWLVLIGDRPHRKNFAEGQIKLTPSSNFRFAGTMSCSISNERYWWVVSGSVGMFAVWRHMTSQWRKNRSFPPNFLSSFYNLILSLSPHDDKPSRKEIIVFVGNVTSLDI